MLYEQKWKCKTRMMIESVDKLGVNLKVIGETSVSLQAILGADEIIVLLYLCYPQNIPALGNDDYS